VNSFASTTLRRSFELGNAGRSARGVKGGVGIRAATVAVVLVVTSTLGAISGAASNIGTIQTVAGMSQVDAVACPSSSTCVALGRYPGVGSSSVGNGDLVFADVDVASGKLNTDTVIPGALDAPSNGLSCVSSRLCWMISSPSPGFPGLDVFGLEVGIGPTPAGEGQSGWVPSELSCGSATHCYVAVTSGTSAGVMPVKDGVPEPVIVIPGLSGAAQALGVACVSATSCVVSGREGSGGYLGLIVGTKVRDVSNLPSTWLNEIVCPTSSTCVAVGGTSSSPNTSIVATLNPSNAVLGKALPVKGRDVELDAVACSSAESCVAAGHVTPAGQRVSGAYVSFVKGHIGKLVEENGVAGINGAGCTATSKCFLGGVDSRGNIGAEFEVTLP